MNSLHDCSLTNIRFDWTAALAEFQMVGLEGASLLIAAGVEDLQLSRALPWGPSEWINRAEGPVDVGDGIQALRIEMQSGDVITVMARSFKGPDSLS